MRKDFLRQVVGHLGRGLHVDFVRFLHERVDDVGLTAGVQLVAYERVDLIASRLGFRRRLDRDASRWQLADDGHVEIAVERQRERPGNGRRRHHEHVRQQPLIAQRRTLEDTEAMLLVDHDEAKLVESNVALHESVRADHEMDRSCLDLRELAAALPARRGSGEQCDAERRAGEEPREVEEMLLRQNLRRGHEGDLQAVFHGDDRRQQRDDGLARADVALQQPIHRMRTLEVVDDFLQRALLSVRQLERQHASRGFANAIVNRHHDRLVFRRR